MPKKLNHKRIDWSGLYLVYDTNNNGYIEMAELGMMIKDAGMTLATNVEIAFAWMVIAAYQPKMNMKTFFNWGKSFEG